MWKLKISSKLKIFLIIIFFIFLWFFISNNYLSNNINNSLEKKIINVSEKAKKSIVNIIAKKDLILYKNDPWGLFKTEIWKIKQKIWWWSWFFITNDWIIITNKHVISDSETNYIVITNDWKEYESKIIYIDKKQDIALLKINSDIYPKLNIIKNQKEIKTWNFVIAIWNVLDKYQNSVSLWIVSWKNRNLWEWWLENMIQTDANINPWNSWGPLINLKSEVIWINTAIIKNSKNLWFAIPINQKYIYKILNNIK